jgi:hypothetical protein
MSRADLYLQRPGVLSPDECERWVRGAYGALGDWTACFDGVQFTLGRAYYTHLEEGRAGEYFAEARASDQRVERALPGMQARVRALLAELVVGAPVTPRSGWCGPGLHVFPADGWLACRGGDIHFDTEGLLPDELAARRPALSAIFMLQAPHRGGGLRVWDALYDGDDEVSEPEDIDSTVVEYAPGDLVVIDSYRLHQIQPFQGRRDRVSITVHLVLGAAGWQSWF